MRAEISRIMQERFEPLERRVTIEENKRDREDLIIRSAIEMQVKLQLEQNDQLRSQVADIKRKVDQIYEESVPRAR